MVQHSRILECLYILGISAQVMTLLEDSLWLWHVMISHLNKLSWKDIFLQWNCGPEFLNNNEKDHPLNVHGQFEKLYSRSEKLPDSLIQMVRMFGDFIGTGYCIEKCVTLNIKRGKRVESKGIQLPDEGMRSLILAFYTPTKCIIVKWNED